MGDYKLFIMRTLVLILILFLTLNFGFSQINSAAETRARQELSRRGLDEEAVRERLAQKGIDLNNIDVNDPQALLVAEKSLREVLDEMEKEQISGGIPDNPYKKDTIPVSQEAAKELARQSEEVTDALEEGSTLEEAVSETLIDNQVSALPNATIYGQEIFRTQSLKLYRKSQDVKPPETYVLGVGDIVGISIWGNSEESLIFEINQDGYIKPDGIPRIYLKGIKFGEAKTLLKNRFSNYYSFRDNEFEASLNFSRTINISVVGEVFNYGSFNIPAINTAFNALVAAGGPNNVGSVRNISLYRGGNPEKKIDIYKYLKTPGIQQDFYLEENDIIYVPVAEKLINIKGAIIRPFIYELLPNENLFELINYAGGMRANALLQNIEVKRFENDEERIINLNLNDLMLRNENFALKNGDVVTINSISENYDNIVIINGAVEVDGEFAFSQGLTIKGLFNRTKLRDNALTELVYIKRLNEDKKTVKYLSVNLQSILNGEDPDVILQPKDVITVLSKEIFIEPKNVSVTGAVKRPITMEYDTDGNMTIRELVFLAGGLRKDAANFGYITRKNPNNPAEIEYIRIDLDDALSETPNNATYILEPDDELNIFSNLTFTDEFDVLIAGEVRNPGNFKYDESLTLKDLIILAGGLQFKAAKNRIDIYRVDLSDEKQSKIIAANLELDEELNVKGFDEFRLQPFDKVYVRTAPEFETQKNVSIFGEVKYPGQYAIIQENERILDIINRAGGLTSEAFLEGITIYRGLDGVGGIVIDVKEILDNPRSNHNIILLEGDVIQIPKERDLVSITGFTKSYDLYQTDLIPEGKVSVPFEKGKNAMYYVRKYAGGVNENGDRKNITVQYPNGRQAVTRNYFLFKKYPAVEKGSVVFVGPKEEKEDKRTNNEERVDWGVVLSNAMAQATSVLTLLLLAQRLN